MNKIVADENILDIESIFNEFGNITLLSGREISSSSIVDANILLIRSITKVNHNLLNKSKIKFIGSATSGIDHVDIEYLKKNNIHFSYAPGCNATSVVEYVLASITEISNQRKNDWRKKIFGIIGRGQIGTRLHDILKIFNVECKIYDPFAPANDGNDAKLNELLSQCDVVSLHVPLTTNGLFPTRHLIGKKELQLMKPNSLLINTSRGSVVNNIELNKHIDKNLLFDTVIDVWENEPFPYINLINKVTIATGHIAGYSIEGKLAGTKGIYLQLCEFLGKTSKTKNEKINYIKIDANNLKTIMKKNSIEQLNEIIKHIYNIEQDSKAFKKIMTNTCQQKITGSIFDNYRKKYRQRREFSSLKVNHNLQDKSFLFEDFKKSYLFYKKLGFINL